MRLLTDGLPVFVLPAYASEHDVVIDQPVSVIAPLVVVVVAEEPGSAAESPVELAKESLQPVAGLLFSKNRFVGRYYNS